MLTPHPPNSRSDRDHVPGLTWHAAGSSGTSASPARTTQAAASSAQTVWRAVREHIRPMRKTPMESLVVSQCVCCSSKSGVPPCHAKCVPGAGSHSPTHLTVTLMSLDCSGFVPPPPPFHKPPNPENNPSCTDRCSDDVLRLRDLDHSDLHPNVQHHDRVPRLQHHLWIFL